jgi:RNA polymerase-binding transcription factor DksA
MQSIAIEAKRRLLDRRRQLFGLRRHVDEAENELLEAREEDSLDLSVAQRAASVLEELSGSELRELREVDAALQRLKEDSYGRCEQCGIAIGRLRLRAIPEARNCLACASQQAMVTVG